MAFTFCIAFTFVDYFAFTFDGNPKSSNTSANDSNHTNESGFTNLLKKE